MKIERRHLLVCLLQSRFYIVFVNLLLVNMCIVKYYDLQGSEDCIFRDVSTIVHCWICCLS